MSLSELKGQLAKEGGLTGAARPYEEDVQPTFYATEDVFKLCLAPGKESVIRLRVEQGASR
jgi:hypothetical protein